MFNLIKINEPVYTHDCSSCLYLGTMSPRSEKEKAIDCYWCNNGDSIIGRYGSEGPDYAASMIPDHFAGKGDYLYVADRWYLFALLRAVLKGLYKPSFPI